MTSDMIDVLFKIFAQKFLKTKHKIYQSHPKSRKLDKFEQEIGNRYNAFH